MELIQMVPLLILAGFIGYCTGYGSGRRVQAARIIATALEGDLLKEVKRRRVADRISQEVDEQVECEAGTRP